MRARRLAIGLILALGASTLAGAGSATATQAGAWHLSASFGRGGVANLAVRERLHEEGSQGAPAPPERDRSLLASGPRGSVFAGGFARGRPGAFLLTRMTAGGRLDRSFGSGGVLVVPAVHWFRTDPPRLIALPAGGVLVVGLSQADQLVAVRLTAGGALDRAYGRGGVARYALSGAHAFAIITAAAVEPGGDLLAVYQKELAQPLNQPRVPEGQGNGSLRYMRLLATGALDHTFGNGGYLQPKHPEVFLLEGESGTVGACAETLSSTGALLIAYEGFALEELAANGTLLTAFGEDPVAPVQAGVPEPPDATKNAFHLCNGLFALAGGAVEGIDGRRVLRLTPSGMPDAAFGAAGVSALETTVQAAVVASDGELFSVGESSGKLALSGVLADGQADSALGGAKGTRFAVALPPPGGSSGSEEATWELLPGARSLTIRVGEELIRLLE
jgi:hypothetical protein